MNDLAGGMTEAEIIREYDLTAKDIRAALAYAAQLVEYERVSRFICHHLR